MLVSLNLIEKFISLPKIAGSVDVETIASILTRQGFEVESITHRGAGFEKVVVGQIVSASTHPSADKLQVCQVAVANGQTLQIVCGAKNARADLFVAVALPGTRLPNGTTIGQAELRGVQSNGMLCAREELGLATQKEIDGEGIWELDVDAQGGKNPEILKQGLGQSVFDVLELSDVLLDISVTPNRPDMLCHEGVARELAAGFAFASIPFQQKNPADLWKKKVSEEKIKQDVIENAIAKCGEVSFSADNHIDAPTFFVTLSVDHVAHSPAWLRNTLETLGQTSVNAIVDASNYILLAYGQPNHAFDLDAIAQDPKSGQKKLIVRHAHAQEVFLGLDHKERFLHESDCVVADVNQIQALLGVLGGMTSRVSLQTKKIVVEFANPNPVKIRRTSRRQGRQTEASFLFEKGIDIAARFRAASLFVSLIDHLCNGNSHYTGGVHSQNLEAFPAVQTDFPLRLIPLGDVDQEKILGTKTVDFQTQVQILKSLCFETTEQTDHTALFRVPSWRWNDVVGAADLIEECIRVVGIDSVPAVPMTASLVVGRDDAHFSVLEQISACASGLGYHEVIDFHFMREDDWQKLNLKCRSALGQPVQLLNPIIGDEPLMHSTLLPNLLRKVALNFNLGIQSGQLFHNCRTFQNANQHGEVVFEATEANQACGNLFEYDFKFAHAYSKDDLNRPTETPRLAGVCFGDRVEKNWQNQAAVKWTLHDVMAHVIALGTCLGLKLHRQVLDSDHPMFSALHPGKAVGFFLCDGKNQVNTPVGWCGELHPKVLRSYDIQTSCFAFEVNLSAAMKSFGMAEKTRAKTYHSSKFPPVTRDFAFLLDNGVSAKQLDHVVRSALENLISKETRAWISDVKIFDIYKGQGIAAGKKSVTFNVTLIPIEKTWTDADIQKITSCVVQAVSDSLQGELRG